MVTILLVAALLCLRVIQVSAEESERPPATGESIVYFTTDLTPDGVMKVYDRIRGEVRGKVALKVHFGEEGNDNYIRPEMIRDLQAATQATLVETNVLYPGPRHSTKSHLELAYRHGFGFAPIDILDSDGETVFPASAGHFNEIRVGSHQDNYDTYIIFSHFKGHGMSGFGGAIKNVSMGLASITGKLALHASHYPFTEPSKCIGCGLCLRDCAGEAITLNPVVVDPSKCVGCGKCIQTCPQKVFSVPWKKGDKAVFMEKLADYAKAISGHSHMVYINVLSHISPDCDCMDRARPPFVQDIGVLSSLDPVALDAACMDLVDRKYGSSDAFQDVNSVSGRRQLEYGQKIGLGNTRYRLVRLDR